MWKIAIFAVLASLAMTSAAIAQDKPHRLAVQNAVMRDNDVSAERDALCAHAASVAARTGVSNETDLSQEQLFSLFLLVSLKQSTTHHS